MSIIRTPQASQFPAGRISSAEVATSLRGDMKHSTTLILLALAIFVLASGCSRTNVQQSLNQTVHEVDNSTKVLADYQPWFGDRDHINVGYSSDDPNVLRKQIEHAKDIGIYAFAVDWYGHRRPFLDHSYAVLQQVANQNHFHVCLMYDETQEDTGSATEDALDAMDEAYKKYIGPQAPGRDAYVRYENRPVIFIFPKKGNTDWDRVREAVNAWETPPLLIYADDPPSQYTKDFDGEYAWVHPSKGWSPDGSDWGKQYLEGFYKKMENRRGKITVGGVWPGFNDAKASWGLNRHMDRRCGRTFEDTLQMFRQYDAAHPMPFIMLATWNDYEEGTQIEDGISDCNRQQQRASAAQPSR
jgi:Glycosyl hydrolase family 99